MRPNKLRPGGLILKSLKIIILTLIFAMGLYFVMQNIQVLGQKLDLVLNLWWAGWNISNISIYLIFFLSFFLGILFVIIVYHPRSQGKQEELKLMQEKFQLLRQELTTLQKETHQELQQRQQQAAPEEEADLPGLGDFQTSTVSLWSKTAIAGFILVFILLTVFYFYTQNELQQLSGQLTASQERTQALAESLQNSTAELQDRTELIQGQLVQQGQEILELQKLPQKNKDYLTKMYLQSYIHDINYLAQDAQTEQDLQKLEQVQKALNSALEHYQNKNQE